MNAIRRNAGATIQVSLFEIDAGGPPGGVDKLHSDAYTSCPEKALGGKGGAYPLPEEVKIRSIGDVLKGRIVRRPPPPRELFAARVAKNETEQVKQYCFARLKPAWDAKGHTKLTKSFFGMLTSHLKGRDWLYMKSLCDQEAARGQPFSAVFWGSLKPKQITP